MLVLSRRVGDSIRIGDDILIYVTRVSGTRVTLGIEAPRSVCVLRGEVPKITESSGGPPPVDCGTAPSETSPISN